ncbi:hypothetical protein ACEPAI_9239 [Sanghuangporus weigelae]
MMLRRAKAGEVIWSDFKVTSGSKKEEVKRLAGEIGCLESHVTVLFSNAGVLEGGLNFPPADPAPNTSLEPASKSTMAAAYFEHYWAVTPEAFDSSLLWKKRRGGSKFAPQIIMTSCVNGWTKDISTAGLSVSYAMSKSAIGHFTSYLARDLLPLDIRVNGIAPGWFITNMTAPGTMDTLGMSHIDPNERPESRLRSFPYLKYQTRQAPGAGVPILGGSNRDIGTLALFLVANWYANGETVPLDGGISFIPY